VLFDSHNGLIVANSLTCCQGILTSGLIRTWKESRGLLAFPWRPDTYLTRSKK
jgi:hypothetical protein